MDAVIFSIVLIGLTYWLAKPSVEVKRQVGRPRKPKKFGEGLLIDTAGFNWWKSNKEWI
jgi:hypothetical protein